ncbi:major facilitator superfamily domain-containing protein [Fennellomyces sp. T-0311]|nr:major facilitator superfamily domain-containing protein [Fennellomyces sp. T-0311]
MEHKKSENAYNNSSSLNEEAVYSFDTINVNVPTGEVLEKEATKIVEEPHCVFSKPRKLVITAIVSYAGLVSPFSSTIYFPALNPIAQEFDVSVSLVNLSVTVYMIFQALSPAFWGSLSDLWGRRPVYIGTLSIFVGVCIGLAMAPTFPVLLGMRMLQAFGASSGIALGAGVIGDFTTPAERGGYFGLFTSCQMACTAVGPVLGGIVSQQLSWRWVFWLLLIIGAVGLLAVIFLLPETLRSIVGNGSGYANPTPTQWLKKRLSKENPSTLPRAGKSRFRTIPNFLEPFLFLRHPDVILTMIINGFHSAVLFTYMTTTPTYFYKIYGLNELQVGLCYLPYGLGSIIGSTLGGRILNHDFKVVARKQGIPPEQVKSSGKLSLDFPIYIARLRTSWILPVIGQALTISYGWVLYSETHLAVPLILQFLVGLCSTSVFSFCQTLMIDLFPGKGASITATNNVVRSMLGAAATAGIEPCIERMGLGWAYTFLGLWWRNRVENDERAENRRRHRDEEHVWQTSS